MNDTNSYKYDFIYPNYYLSKNFEIDSSIFQNLDLISYGNQKKFSTNIYEGLQVNDLIFSAESPFLNNKINNDFKFLVKNVNTNGKNSEKYKSQTQGELMTNLIYDLSLNLKKEEEKYNKFLTPKVSLRYSPNSTKNIQSLDRKLDINNLYSLNRIGTSDDIEGGASITIGNKFELKNKNSEQILGINLGTVFNDKNKKQLPLNNTLRNSQSDFVGNIIFKPNTNLEFDYNFSLDNQLDDTNLHQFKTKFKINNFVI
jgi:LPS-assembly protein